MVKVVFEERMLAAGGERKSEDIAWRGRGLVVEMAVVKVVGAERAFISFVSVEGSTTRLWYRLLYGEA